MLHSFLRDLIGQKNLNSQSECVKNSVTNLRAKVPLLVRTKDSNYVRRSRRPVLRLLDHNMYFTYNKLFHFQGIKYGLSLNPLI